MSASRSISLLIAAMGGEGGGVLREWLVEAATAEGLAVQSTSIPGVAQRTGATTYYIEMMAPADGAERPVMSLYPMPGSLDMMVASELLEAGRAMQNGFVTPECTTLVASTHRVYAIDERTAMDEGRFNGELVVKAAAELAQRPVLFDMEAMARRHGSVINAVLLGAIAGSGRLPIPLDRFEAAIREQGRAVEANLAAFRAGFAAVERGDLTALTPDIELKREWRPDPPMVEEMQHRVREEFPPMARTVLREGVNRLVEYQGLDYAGRYLERLARLDRIERQADGDGRLVREAGRHLALWMAYEDVVRVAQIKTRPDRLDRIREEVSAQAGEPVRLTEVLKPGVEEAASLLPLGLGRGLVALTKRLGVHDRLNLPLAVPSTSVWGFFLLRLLAGLRPLRRFGHRFREEQSAIDHWLDYIAGAAALDLSLAREIAACQSLVKGYGDTHQHGLGSFRGIMDTLVVPALNGHISPGAAAEAVARARRAALADPAGDALRETLREPEAPSLAAE